MSEVLGLALPKQHTVLVVGEVFQLYLAEHNLADDSKITFADITDISSIFLNNLKPDIVVSCLVCRDFDFLELAQALELVGFQGIFRVITPVLPNPKIVASEAHSMCPTLNFKFIVAPEMSLGLMN